MKTGQPLVSIIMPAYNAAGLISQSIECVIAQVYKNWELIIIDDGSIDETFELAKSFKDARIVVVKREHGGQGHATNYGLHLCKGDYIQFLDADDIMDSSKISVQINDLKDYGNEYVGISRWSFFYDDISNAVFNNEPVYFSGESKQWLHALWLHETMMSNHGYLTPRGVIEKAGKFYDTSLDLNIDFEYFTRVLLAAKGVVYSPRALCYYRKQVENSLTHKPGFKMKLNALNARVKAINYLFQFDHSPQARKAAQMALTILTFSFPEIYLFAKRSIKSLGLKSFADFGGKRFKKISSFIGFEKTIQLKSLLQKFPIAVFLTLAYT